MRRSLGFLVVTSGLGAAIPALGLLYTGFSGVASKGSYVIGFFMTGWVAMLALSMIEFLGVRFFGGRRGWRVDAPVAACVVSHASVGWIGAGVIVAFAWQVFAGLVAAGKMPMFVYLGPEPVHTTLLVLGGSMVLGIVVYESLVFFGVRAMKYANAAGAC